MWPLLPFFGGKSIGGVSLSINLDNLLKIEQCFEKLMLNFCEYHLSIQLEISGH